MDRGSHRVDPPVEYRRADKNCTILQSHIPHARPGKRRRESQSMIHVQIAIMKTVNAAQARTSPVEARMRGDRHPQSVVITYICTPTHRTALGEEIAEQHAQPDMKIQKLRGRHCGIFASSMPNAIEKGN